jgi:hypothetical protein
MDMRFHIAAGFPLRAVFWTQRRLAHVGATVGAMLVTLWAMLALNVPAYDGGSEAAAKPEMAFSAVDYHRPAVAAVRPELRWPAQRLPDTGHRSYAGPAQPLLTRIVAARAAGIPEGAGLDLESQSAFQGEETSPPGPSRFAGWAPPAGPDFSGFSGMGAAAGQPLGPLPCCAVHNGPTSDGPGLQPIVDGLTTASGPVPEASTWALFVLGFGVTGAALRGRRGRPA